MIVRKLTVATILLLLTASLGYSLSSNKENDAGSGGDAGDTLDTAYRLPAWGAYEGAMVKHNTIRDTDWYRAPPIVETQAMQCVEFTGAANMWTNITVVARTPNGDLVTNPGFIPDKRTYVYGGIAVPALMDAWLGNVPNDHTSSGDPTRPGNYSFSFHDYDAASLGSGDGGLDGDAGNSFSNATPAPAPCFSGILKTNLGDSRDIYSFTAKGGTSVGISFALPGDQEALLGLYDSAGVKLAEVASGSITHVPITTDGTYYVSVIRTDMPTVGTVSPVGTMSTSSSSTSVSDTVVDTEIPYLIGIVMGPERPGCKPHC